MRTQFNQVSTKLDFLCNWRQPVATIESIKTTSMQNVSTEVLDKTKNTV